MEADYNTSRSASLINERIKQRSDNVHLIAEQNRAKRESNSVSTENTDYFSENFIRMKENINKKVAEAKSIDKDKLVNYLDEVVRDVGKLQNMLNQSSMFLASFNIKKAQESVNDTNDIVQACIQELQPKKKFGFKTKTKKPNVQKAKESNDINDGKKKENCSSIIKGSVFYGFKDITGMTLEKSAEEIKSRQLHLQNLTDCRVKALGNPSSLQFSNLRNTTVIIGPTSRSALIKDCLNCTFVLACQQVRIHNTEDAKFYLHVTGAAIIENCKGLAFGPYTLEYDDLVNDYEQSGLSRQINNWRNVEDFYWFNDSEKSPNFYLLEEDCWEKDWL